MAEEPLSFQAFVEDELRRNPNQTTMNAKRKYKGYKADFLANQEALKKESAPDPVTTTQPSLMQQALDKEVEAKELMTSGGDFMSAMREALALKVKAEQEAANPVTTQEPIDQGIGSAPVLEQGIPIEPFQKIDFNAVDSDPVRLPEGFNPGDPGYNPAIDPIFVGDEGFTGDPTKQEEYRKKLNTFNPILNPKPPNPQELKEEYSDLDPGFFDAPEFQDYLSAGKGIGTMDMYNSPYFGMGGSGSIGKAQDRAYEAYLDRIKSTDAAPVVTNPVTDMDPTQVDPVTEVDPTIGSFTGQQPMTYAEAVADARKRRAEGFKGRVKLPGEMSEEDFNKWNAKSPTGATFLTDSNINPNATPDLGGLLDPGKNPLPNPNPVETTTMAAGDLVPDTGQAGGSPPAAATPAVPGTEVVPVNPTASPTTSAPATETPGIPNLSDGIGAQLKQLFQQYMGSRQQYPNNYSNPMQQYRTAVTDTDEYKAYNDYASSLGPTEEQRAELQRLQSAFEGTDAYNQFNQQRQQRRNYMQPLGYGGGYGGGYGSGYGGGFQGGFGGYGGGYGGYQQPSYQQPYYQPPMQQQPYYGGGIMGGSSYGYPNNYSSYQQPYQQPYQMAQQYQQQPAYQSYGSVQPQYPTQYSSYASPFANSIANSIR